MHGTVSLGPWGAISIYIYLYMSKQPEGIHPHTYGLTIYVLAFGQRNSYRSVQ